MENGLSSIPIEQIPFGVALHREKTKDGVPYDFEYIQVNQMFLTSTGLEKEAVIGRTMREVFPSVFNDSFDWVAFCKGIYKSGEVFEYVQHLKDVDKYYKLRSYSTEPGYFISFLVDISQEINRRERYKMIVLSIDDGVIAVDLDNRVTMMNSAAEKFTGWDKTDAAGKELTEIFKVHSSLPPMRSDLLRQLNSASPVRVDDGTYLTTKDGGEIPVAYSVFPIIQDVKKQGATVIFKDISIRAQKDQEISYITYHDSLTGLYNRTFFNEKIDNIEHDDMLPLSLIMGDVNGLKLTNDAFGHLKGDKLLQAAAAALKAACRSGDLIIRWGGDEFIILLPKTSGPEAEAVCRRITQSALEAKVDFLDLSISLGYATQNTAGQNFNDILKMAEDMMYSVKLLESRSMKSRTLNIILRTLYERSRAECRHAENVSMLCSLIGRAMGLRDMLVTELGILGLVHDIGKIGINQNIIIKSDKLNAEEWYEVKKHSEIGYHIISSSNEMANIALSVLAHHERIDGNGYPKGLKGSDIPLLSRILSVADAFDSMVTERPYKKAKTKDEVLNEFLSCSGKQFDSEIVRIFIEKVITLPGFYDMINNA